MAMLTLVIPWEGGDFLQIFQSTSLAMCDLEGLEELVMGIKAIEKVETVGSKLHLAVDHFAQEEKKSKNIGPTYKPNANFRLKRMTDWVLTCLFTLLFPTAHRLLAEILHHIITWLVG